jgi:Holliday junction resolvase RusA-like endonuclease
MDEPTTLVPPTGMSSISFVVEANPKPLARPVVGRGARFSSNSKVWLRDPNKEAKAAFRNAVKILVFGNTDARILFDATTPIVVDITFLVKAPTEHFVNRDRASGRIKEAAITQWPTKPDIDNLDKFVLDSLQGLLYVNDSQVVQQQIQKLYHHQPPFTGQTVVFIHRADPSPYG